MAITKQKLWTYEDYYNLKDDKRHELIEGELIEMPAPNIKHQEISGNLEFLIRAYVKQKNLGKVYDAPTDVKFDEHHVIQPDILFISNEKKGIIKENCIEGTPDLVIEILSPSNQAYDKVKKFSVYEKFRVKELWIIDPDEQSIRIYVLKSDKLVSYSDASKVIKLKSKIFTELDISFDDLV